MKYPSRNQNLNMATHGLRGAGFVVVFFFLTIFGRGFWGAQIQAADVVVLLSADVPEYQKAIKGFRDATEHRIVATYDMRGDLGRGREFVQQIETKDKPALIYAVGIFALQAVVKEQPKTPTVFSMVLNPQSILGDSGGNITGVSMNVPVEKTFALLKQLNPSLKRVATIYSDQNTGKLIEKAKAAAKEMDLEFIAKQVGSERDAIRALDDLEKEKFDALWILPDRTTLGNAFFDQSMLLSFRRQVPLIGLSKRHTDSGAVLSLSFASSEDIGRQAGEMATALLAGKSVADLPFIAARKVQMMINLKTAKKLGIQVPEAMLKEAESVVQ